MNYYFKDNKIIAYNDYVIEETKTDEFFDTPFCLDEPTYKLFKQLKKKKYKIENGTLIVGRSKLQLLNSTPPNFIDSYQCSFEINLTKLKEALKFTAKTAERPILYGVFVSDNGCVVASDSFKIYCYNENNVELSETGVVLTREFVSHLTKYDNSFCIMQFNNQVASIQISEDVKVTGRLIVGQYPKLQSIIYANNTKEIIFEDKDIISKTIKLGDLLKSNNNRIVFTQNTISISNFEGQGNEIVEECKTNLEEPLCLSFESYKNVISVLGNNHRTFITSVARPISFTNESNDTVCVVMPIRIL